MLEAAQCGAGAAQSVHDSASIVRLLSYGEPVSGVEIAVEGYRIEPLTPLTWAAFADLAERHNGVFGGCWCVWFHCHPDPPERTEIGNRALKQRSMNPHPRILDKR